VNRAKHEYELAASREVAAKKSFAEQKAIAGEMNDRAIDFRIAKHEADSSRELYDTLSKKLKEAGVLAGLHSSDVQVVDEATVPVVPYRPNVPLYLSLGVLAGIALGVCCAFIIDGLDHTIRDVGEIELSTSIPILGIVPGSRLQAGAGQQRKLVRISGKRNGAHEQLLAGLQDPTIAEAFRTVRTSLLSSLRGGSLAYPCSKVVMVTSGMEKEGKSFVCLNLAAALACNGSKVLLVDADLRRGTMSRVLSQHSGRGLSDLLMNNANGQVSQDEDAYCQIETLPGVTLLRSGACPQGAAELLGTQKMAALIAAWRTQFAYVVLDTSPVLPVTDALVLSGHADVVIIVVRFASSTLASVSRTITLLRGVRASRLFMLVNATDARGSASYDYYHGAGGCVGEEAQLLVRPSSQSSSESRGAS
jgi:capsular exopolysaccharide synthesis family protein